MVLLDSDKVSRVSSYSRKQILGQHRFRVHGSHVLWLAIQTILLATLIFYLIEKSSAPHRKSDPLNELKSLTWSFVNLQHRFHIRLTAYPWLLKKMKKVWARPVSLATTPRFVIYFLFLALLRCFSSGGSLSITLCIQVTMHTTWLVAGFPIRKSPDMMLVDSSPRLIAVFHVLHR